jgi:hypothetical protein
MSRQRRDRVRRKGARLRVDYAKSFPKGLEAMLALEALTFQVVTINGWNRLAVGLRTPVGDYVSPFRPATGA